PGGGSGGMPRNRLIAIIAAVGAALVIGLVMMMNAGDPAPAKNKVAAIQRPGQPAPAAAPVNEEALVQRADQAFAAGRYAATDGSSAAELYSQALALVRTDERARSGLTRSVDFALREAESSLTAGRIDEVESRIAALRTLSPGNPRLDFLVAQLGRERERAAIDEARRNASEGRQARLRASLALVTEKLRRGALLEPARDSALYHLRASQDIAPGDPDVNDARDALIARLLTTAESELQARQVANARRMLDAAGNLGAESAALDKLRRSADQITTELAAASAPARAVTVTVPAPATTLSPAAATPAATPATPVAASTPVAAASPTSDVLPASSLKLLRQVKAEYPQRALDRGVNGWVELEFTVARDGAVRDIVVTASEPKEMFENSAVSAVRKWRYAPVMLQGQPVEQRAKVRLRYTAKDQ
ncbi:MAG: energy transducer TonB, partial [Pseudomonadota bacterium]